MKTTLPPVFRIATRFATCLVAGLGFSLALVTGANADIGRELPNRYTVFAEVIDVQPSYRRVSVQEPQRECWVEEQQHVVNYESHGYQRPAPRPDRTHHRQSRTSSTDVVVGSVIGGVIGNQLGRKSSSGKRTGATVAGAILGGVVANEVGGKVRERRSSDYEQRHGGSYTSRPQYNQVVESRPVQRCDTRVSTRYEQRIEGYEVTYRYDGQTFRTHSRRDPGRQIELKVSLSPARQ